MHSDFDAFYQSSQALLQGKNPYQVLNLNPPIFLLLFSPLSHLSSHQAFLCLSLIMALCLFFSIRWALELFAKELTYKHWYSLLFVCSFPVLTNFIIGQVTAFIFFLIMGGFYLLEKKKFFFCACTWGLLTALKFFPALLFFYLIRLRHYRLCLMFCTSISLCLLIPALLYGPDIYSMYLTRLSNITWYSHSWNLSLYSIPFKLFLTRSSGLSDAHYLTLLSLTLCALGLAVYLKILFLNKINTKQQFFLTICFMLLLSPFAWQYYFILLFMPVIYLIKRFNTYNTKQQSALLTSMFLLLMPLTNDFLPRDNHNALMIFVYYCLPTIGIPVIINTLRQTTNITKDFVVKTHISIIIILNITALCLVVFYTDILFIKHTLGLMKM
tara:strand:- start:278 stop:1429 length:1152 start_codon:yes stop_codon:yes gene_type:complete